MKIDRITKRALIDAYFNIFNLNGIKYVSKEYPDFNEKDMIRYYEISYAAMVIYILILIIIIFGLGYVITTSGNLFFMYLILAAYGIFMLPLIGLVMRSIYKFIKKDNNVL